MKFVYPDFLFALLALIIPILIHLFNFKKFKRIEFSNVSFLKEIRQESKSKSRLKEWLILLSRLLAIAGLVFAFAQPFFPSSTIQKKESEKAVSIYVDNSFSMNGNGAEGRLLDMAKQYAYKVIESYPAGQKFHLITNNPTQQSDREYSKEAIEEQLDAIKTSPYSQSLDKQIRLQEKWLNGQKSKTLEGYLISDFQAKSFQNRSDFLLDTNINYNWIKLEQNGTDNLFIDSVWIETPSVRVNENLKINYRVRNAGILDINGTKVSLTVNEETYSSSLIDVQANTFKENNFIFKPSETGVYKLVLELIDYPIEYDNKWFFSFSIAPFSRVLILNNNDTSTILAKVFDQKKQFKTEQFKSNQFDYSKLKNTDILLLNELKTLNEGLIYELKKFVENGGVLCVIPNLEVTTENTNLFEAFNIGKIIGRDTLNYRANVIQLNDPFYADVLENQNKKFGLPAVYNSLNWKTTQMDASTSLLGLENNRPLLYRKEIKNGKIFVWSSNLNPKNSNLSEHSVFLISMYKIGLSKSIIEPMYYLLEPNLTLTTNYTKSSEFLKMEHDSQTFIPKFKSIKNELKIWPYENVTTAGFYNLINNDSLVKVFAINYARDESYLNFAGIETLNKLVESNENLNLIEDNLGSFEYQLNQINNGKSYWEWCLIFALIMLATEIFLIKLYRD